MNEYGNTEKNLCKIYKKANEIKTGKSVATLSLKKNFIKIIIKIKKKKL